jgi:hypothetical protein
MAATEGNTLAKRDVQDFASATQTEFLDEMEGHIERAYAMLDGLFTLANTGDVGALQRGSLGGNIDAIMRQVAEMRLALDTHRMDLTDAA